MSEEKKKNKKANIVQNIRDINEKERQAAAEAEEKRREERRAREEAAKEAYERKLRQERIELMQMKQGIISEEESEIAVKKEEEPKKYTLKQRIESFFYLNKLGIFVGIFIVAVAGIFIYDLVTTKDSDCALMYTPYNSKLQYNYDGMDALFTSYIEDYNNDGEVRFDTYWICPPHEMNNMNYEQFQASSTQMYAHFQSGKAVLIMCDEWVYEEFGLDTSLEDLTERYPDSKFVTEKGIYLYDTNFYELIGVEKEYVPEDLFISIRTVHEGEKYTNEMQENYDIGIALLDKLMSELEYRG